MKGQKLKEQRGIQLKSQKLVSALEPDEASRESTNNDLGALAVMLRQLLASLCKRAREEDAEVLRFSLHHLFCGIDLLYRYALPALETRMGMDTGGEQRIEIGTTPSHLNSVRLGEAGVSPDERLWGQLQTTTRIVHRLEPICHLVSDAAECMLERLDAPDAPGSSGVISGTMEVIGQKQWDEAFTVLCQVLKSWQQSYRACTPFAPQFAGLKLDATFRTLLDNACALFGDVLPASRSLSGEEDEDVATLLFDLIQHSDQMLLQFDAALERLDSVVERFT